jgi:uncharacterized repeat protein (TIGR01451 family)
VFTFAGYSFDDTAAPNKGSFLAANATFDGALVSDVPTNATSSTLNFPDAPAGGFNSNLALGTAFFGGSGPRALNLPSGNDGTTKRSGVLLEYTGQRALQNNAGPELLAFESGGKTAVLANPQAYMIQAFVIDTGTWTRWYYTPAAKFGYYSGSETIGAFATEYDLSDLGVPAGALVSQVRLVNMTAQDRMDSATGIGFVRPGDAGATSMFLPTPGAQSTQAEYERTSYDPDPLFVASLSTPVSTDKTANVVVSQSVAPAVPLTAGTKATFAVTVTNAGASTASGVTFTGTLPAELTGLTFTSTLSGGATGATAAGSGTPNDVLTLPAMGTAVYTITGTIDPAATSMLATTFTAGLPAAPVTDTNPADNTSSASYAVQTVGNAVVTISSSALTAGSKASYTITVANPGPSTLTGVGVSNALPAPLSGVTFTSTASGGATGNAGGSGPVANTLTLPPGGLVTYTVTGTLDSAAVGPVAATVAANVPAPQVNTDPSKSSASTTGTIVRSADLGITIVGMPATAVVGSTVTYILTVTNTGPSLVTGAALQDIFSSAFTSISYTSQASGGATGNAAGGTGDLAQTLTLPSGASVVYTVTANLSPLVTGLVTNSATITAPAGVTDGNPANDLATANVTVTPQANISIEVSPSTIVGIIGQPTTFTVIVTNSGPSGADGVTIAGVVPAGFTNVTFTSTRGGGASGNSPAGTGTPTDTLSLPAGSRVVYTVTGTPTPGTVGTAALKFDLTAPNGTPIGSSSSLSVSSPIVVGAAPKVIYAVGTGVGVPGDVFVYNADGTERFRFRPYENSFTGGVHVAVGDANNDGFPDVVVAPAEGGGPRLVVVDGFTGKLLFNAFVYEPEMRDGVYVALGDTNGSGRNQIVTGPGEGGGPRVRVFDIPSQTVLRDFFAYAPGFRGGVRVAVDSGTNRFVTAPGDGGGPHVRVWGQGGTPVAEFFAGNPASRQGIFIAVGDLDNSGNTRLVAGTGPGGPPVVTTHNLQTGQAINQFRPYETTFTGGVRVATYVDTTGTTPQTRILTGAGLGGGPRVQDFSAEGADLRTNQFIIPTDFRGGIFVG